MVSGIRLTTSIEGLAEPPVSVGEKLLQDEGGPFHLVGVPLGDAGIYHVNRGANVAHAYYFGFNVHLSYLPFVKILLKEAGRRDTMNTDTSFFQALWTCEER